MSTRQMQRPMSVDVKQFQDVMGYVPTAVTAIVTRVETELVGMVVGTFASVSEDPPLVSIMVTSQSGNWAKIRQAGHFTASVLSSDQRAASHLLSGQARDKFRSVPLVNRGDDTVIIDGCVAWTRCVIEQEIPVGDHVIVLARPSDVGLARQDARPMVFFRRGYHRTLQTEDPVALPWV